MTGLDLLRVSVPLWFNIFLAKHTTETQRHREIRSQTDFRAKPPYDLIQFERKQEDASERETRLQVLEECLEEIQRKFSAKESTRIT